MTQRKLSKSKFYKHRLAKILLTLKCFLIITLLSASPLLAGNVAGTASYFAKDVVVTGQVLDDKGEPLAGVSVTLKGTNIGTTTNADGNFTITVPDANSILVFTSVGFSEQEYPLNGNTNVTFIL